MCLIIAPGRDGQKALLPKDVYDFVYDRNNDGLGGMYVKDGRVEHFKVLNLSKQEQYDYMSEMVERHPDIIFHMRYKTHGSVIPSLVHPFRILHKNRHGKDLFFMHNGVLGDFGKNLRYGQSDTTNFKDKILIPLLTRNPDALDDPEIMAGLNKLTSGSRLIFLDSNGTVYRTSENSWNNRYGLTLSNTYMLPAQSSTSYSSKSNDNNWQEDWRKKQEAYLGSLPKGTKGPKEKDGEYYGIFRRVKYQTIAGGTEPREEGMWFRQIKKGFLRSEFGGLYRDQGPGIVLQYPEHYVTAANEFKALMEEANQGAGAEKTIVLGKEDDELDDDLPFDTTDATEDMEETQYTVPSSNTPSSLDERLRYARLVHNCHGNEVTDRLQLLADFMGMDNNELYGFTKEDPQTAVVVMSELYEIILEMNDQLSEIDSEFGLDDNPLTFSMDDLITLGGIKHHMKSMTNINTLRREKYKEQLQQKIAESEDIPAVNTEVING